jgi:membrane associated rhomboid family serine protease
MIPLRDDNPTRHVPIVTLAIIALNFLAFLIWEPTFGTQQQQQTFFFCNAEIPWEVTHQTTLGEGGPEARQVLANQLKESSGEAEQDQRFLAEHCATKVWWQSIFVAMFLHGGWLHILGNMLFLWIFGNNVEDKLGVIGFPLFYLASGVAASLAQLAISANSIVPNLGASGAIAGVLGAYLVMFPRRRVLTLIIFFFITWVYLPAYVVLGLWFVLQLFSGVGELGSRVNSGGGVAFWAHIGGFAFGAALAALFFPKERFGAEPPPRRPDVHRGSWGWGSRRRQPPDDDRWRPY